MNVGSLVANGRIQLKESSIWPGEIVDMGARCSSGLLPDMARGVLTWISGGS